MRHLLSLMVLALAACGEPIADNHFANQANVAASSDDSLIVAAKPVRIGELGPSFDACTGIGTTRRRGPADVLVVRSAPFDGAAQTAQIKAGARFFICTRTLDQKWFGVVFYEDGELAARCGVSEPVPRRSDYSGPCGSGWISSPLVKIIAGNDQIEPTQGTVVPSERTDPRPQQLGK